MNRLSTVSALVGVLVLAGISSVGQSGVIRDDRNEQLYLDLGASPLYASVGQVDGTTASSSFLASGTLIAEDWVLTAAHVVQGAKTLTFTIGGKTYAGTSWVMNSKFTSGNLGAGYDIGLIHLGEAVAGIAPAVRYTGDSELGMLATSVGFGRTGTGLTGANDPNYQKRAGQNMVDAFYPVRKGAVPNVILMDFDNPHNAADSSYGDAEPVNLEYLIAPGDSGGGLFADFMVKDVLTTQLIGIHSFGWGRLDGKPDSDYGDVSGDTRVSVFNKWIDNALASLGGGGGNGGGKGGGKGAKGGNGDIFDFDMDDIGGYVVFDGLAALPEPCSAMLLAFGAMAVMRRRRA